jgi:uncharacterized membrane protein
LRIIRVPYRVLARHLRRTFVAGIVVLVPVVITFVLARWLFNIIDGLLQPAVERVLGWTWPGMGILILLVVIYAIGLVWASVIGKRVIGWAQTGLLEVPLINAIYQAAKDLIESFSGQHPTGFNRVVAIEYPRSGSWALGFLTGIATDETGTEMGIVYIPTSPTPQTGWVAILPMEQVFDVDMPVSQAMRLVLSGGIISPSSFLKTPAVGREAATSQPQPQSS